VQVANQCGVGRDTVDDTIQAAVRALGARNRTHAVALLVARGLISPPEVEIPSTADPRQTGESAGSIMEDT
jgi:hypothetical protein